jgi:hypothetical protein
MTGFSRIFCLGRTLCQEADSVCPKQWRLAVVGTSRQFLLLGKFIVARSVIGYTGIFFLLNAENPAGYKFALLKFYDSTALMQRINFSFHTDNFSFHPPPPRTIF